VSRLLEFPEELRKRDGPTMREMHEMADEIRRAFPGGVTVYGSKPDDPAEGAMYTEPDGTMMVYAGGVWKKLIISPPVSAPSWGPPGPIGGVAGSRPSAREREEADRVAADPDRTELLEVLLCPECDMELSAVACGPRHAFLADNPMNHRLLKPLLERYQEEIRWAEGKQCSTCSVPLASSDCVHADVRGDQVLMSRAMYATYQTAATELIRVRGELRHVEERLVELKEALLSDETSET